MADFTKKIDWKDLPDETTPVLASDIIRWEEGIHNVNEEVIGNTSSINNLSTTISGNTSSINNLISPFLLMGA